MRHVLVNGTPIRLDGEAIGADELAADGGRPGTVLRGH
jgi:hypothetical protein